MSDPTALLSELDALAETATTVKVVGEVERETHGQRRGVGIEVGSDAASSVDLDEFLVFGNSGPVPGSSSRGCSTTTRRSGWRRWSGIRPRT